MPQDQDAPECLTNTICNHFVNINFTLHKVVVQKHLKMHVILAFSQNGPQPIQSLEDLKFRIQTATPTHNYTNLTGKETSLKRKVLRELNNTRQLIQTFSQLQKEKTSHKHSKNRKRQQRKKRRRNYSSSSNSSDSASSTSTNSSTNK